MMGSKVSIIMNCHNGERYLREAIDSIYAQTVTNWEIIFFDNASTDQSASIAKSYDNRLKYHYNKELITLGAARKCATELASGEWIAFLDCDDIWYPQKLRHQLDGLQGRNYLACYSGVQEIKVSGSKIRDVFPVHSSGNVLEGLLRQFDVNMVTSMFHKDVVERYKINFDPSITASEEYNFFLRVAAKGEFLVQDVILGVYRVSPKSLTNRQIEFWADERRHTLECIQRENSGIEKKYPAAFVEAEARAVYYEAQYMMSQGKKKEASKLLLGVRRQDYRYAILYQLARWPFLWHTVHQRSVRSKILALLKYV